jgi:hypothetical protein
MSNYPDDIRSFDSDSRSPCYVEPIRRCTECSGLIDELADYCPSCCCQHCGALLTDECPCEGETS